MVIGRRRLHQTWANYRRLDRTAKSLPVLGLLAYAQGHRGIHVWQQARRYRNDLNLPINPLKTENPPVIDLLFVVAPKDFHTLPLAITSALRHSVNPISKINLITTTPGLKQAMSLMQALLLETPTAIYTEDEIVSSHTRALLKSRFANRYGWILQQILIPTFVSTSSSAGVWVIDADTIMLEDRLLLDEFGNQVLTPSLEYHPPYYRFLTNHGVGRFPPNRTFVAHWMLMQPQISQSALAEISCSDGESLARLIVNSAEDSAAPICVDYELYAQFMMENVRDKIRLARWSNLPVPLSVPGSLSDLETYEHRYRGYSSISIHSHLQTAVRR